MNIQGGMPSERCNSAPRRLVESSGNSGLLAEREASKYPGRNDEVVGTETRGDQSGSLPLPIDIFFYAWVSFSFCFAFFSPFSLACDSHCRLQDSAAARLFRDNGRSLAYRLIFGAVIAIRPRAAGAEQQGLPNGSSCQANRHYAWQDEDDCRGAKPVGCPRVCSCYFQDAGNVLNTPGRYGDDYWDGRICSSLSSRL